MSDYTPRRGWLIPQAQVDAQRAPYTPPTLTKLTADDPRVLRVAAQVVQAEGADGVPATPQVANTKGAVLTMGMPIVTACGPGVIIGGGGDK